MSKAGNLCVDGLKKILNKENDMTLEELLWACFLGAPILVWAIQQAIAWHNEHLWIPEDREE